MTALAAGVGMILVYMVSATAHALGHLAVAKCLRAEITQFNFFGYELVRTVKPYKNLLWRFTVTEAVGWRRLPTIWGMLVHSCSGLAVNVLLIAAAFLTCHGQLLVTIVLVNGFILTSQVFGYYFGTDLRVIVDELRFWQTVRFRDVLAQNLWPDTAQLAAVETFSDEWLTVLEQGSTRDLRFIGLSLAYLNHLLLDGGLDERDTQRAEAVFSAYRTCQWPERRTVSSSVLMIKCELLTYAVVRCQPQTITLTANEEQHIQSSPDYFFNSRLRYFYYEDAASYQQYRKYMNALHVTPDARRHEQQYLLHFIYGEHFDAEI